MSAAAGPTPPPPSLSGPPPGASPEEIERHWFENVYQGDGSRQLTIRGVITGMLLGGLMALSNLYVALKTGWSLGVTITSAVLAYLLWSGLGKLFKLTPFGVLENNAMQSVASAAGYMTGGGTVAAIPALMIMTGTVLDPWAMGVWIAALAFLGVFVAIPLKRQMINIEQLKFPSGIAAAETVRSLHAHGAEARQRASALAWAGLVGASVGIAKDGFKLFHEQAAIFGSTVARWGFQLELSTIMVGAGAIMGMRVAMSQLLGAVICFGIAAPWAYGQGAIADPVKYKTLVSWTVWFGASMMLTAGLLQFAFGWKAVKRAFGDLAAAVRGGPAKTAAQDPLAAIEVPSAWFVGGVAVLGPTVILLAWFLFGIPPYMGVLAVLMSLVIAIVAARSTGETDTTPSSAMGKLVQITFGVVHPGSVTTNLMTAQMSAGVALHASDLLTDLKSGYVLGAKPRHQFYAQFFGVIAGSLVVVPIFQLLVPDASVIPDKFPAPSAIAWAAVAGMLSKGVSTLHPTAQWSIAIGGTLGIVLVLCERAFPRHKHFIPSPLAFGLAWTFPAWNSVSMALGALVAWAVEKRRPALAAIFVVAVASGLIAGESLASAFANIYEALR